MKSTKQLVFALALTTAASAAIMMISVAWHAGYVVGRSPAAISQTGTGAPLTVEEARTMLAKVTSITGTTITASSFLVGSKAQLATVKVVTNGTTSFARSIPKDQKTLQAEIDAFSAKMKQNPTTASAQLQPPLPFTLEDIALSDIHSGVVIFVTTAEKIVSGQPIVAKKILLESAPPKRK